MHENFVVCLLIFWMQAQEVIDPTKCILGNIRDAAKVAMSYLIARPTAGGYKKLFSLMLLLPSLPQGLEMLFPPQQSDHYYTATKERVTHPV